MTDWNGIAIVLIAAIPLAMIVTGLVIALVLIFNE